MRDLTTTFALARASATSISPETRTPYCSVAPRLQPPFETSNHLISIKMATTVLKGFLALNAALDFAIALVPGFGANALKEPLAGLSEDGVQMFATTCLVHGIFRGLAAYDFDNEWAFTSTNMGDRTRR